MDFHLRRCVLEPTRNAPALLLEDPCNHRMENSSKASCETRKDLVELLEINKQSDDATQNVLNEEKDRNFKLGSLK